MIYTLFWLTGDSEIVEGDTAAEAMTLAGYSNGSLKALDFHSKGNKLKDYVWDKATRSWKRFEGQDTKVLF